MSSEHTRFAGSIPDRYERYMAPVFMVPYAEDLARRVTVSAGGRLLELACGTGVLTRAVAPRIGTASLVATDLNEGMLAVGRLLVQAPNVQMQHADATALPFDAASFDGAICQFGVMFFPDKVRAAAEVRRVVRPGGFFAFNAWASLDENPSARITRDVVLAMAHAAAAPFLLVPFGYCDTRQIAADLHAAGWTNVDIETVDYEGRAESADALALGLVEGTPLVNTLRQIGDLRVPDVTRALAEAFRREYGAGEIRTPMRAYVVTAR